ncbi:hypothetical protein H6G91_02250 [Nostoc muscorum FACHB-395]|uniref:hypothetical protein n=1 Tax=Nostoc sp. C057 TaxID=2576903 RepID=UPI0015C3E1EA|nr:hypothetical protein [Nostoc sp. C057]MBD2506102.1 hypothetical protein [Desmonostoc muscorum FACHB-395]
MSATRSCERRSSSLRDAARTLRTGFKSDRSPGGYRWRIPQTAKLNRLVQQ